MCSGRIRRRASRVAMRRISWIDQRTRSATSACDATVFFSASPSWCWRGVGWTPSSRRPASPAKHDDANHARIGSRCDQAQARSWRSRSCPRWTSDAPRRPPAPQSGCRAGTRWRRTPSRHRRCDGGSADRASIGARRPGWTGRAAGRPTPRSTSQEQAGGNRHPLLSEQRPHPPLHVPQRGRPQFQRRFD